MNVRLRSHNHIEVTLSRRNLLALLHKLDMPGSARQIERFSDNTLLTLRVEDDAEHYNHRREPAGRMHPLTEKFIKDHQE